MRNNAGGARFRDVLWVRVDWTSRICGQSCFPQSGWTRCWHAELTSYWAASNKLYPWGAPQVLPVISTHQSRTSVLIRTLGKARMKSTWSKVLWQHRFPCQNISRDRVKRILKAIGKTQMPSVYLWRPAVKVPIACDVSSSSTSGWFRCHGKLRAMPWLCKTWMLREAGWRVCGNSLCCLHNFCINQKRFQNKKLVFLKMQDVACKLGKWTPPP